MTLWKRLSTWGPILCVAAAVTTAGVAASKGLRDTPVTSVLSDSGTVTSDGHGPYVNFTSRTDNVQSILQTSNTCCNDWILSVGSSSSRSIHVDLTNPVDTVPLTPPFATANVQGRIAVFCHAVFAGSFPAMSSGQALQCPMTVTWPVAGSNDTWRVSFTLVDTETELPLVTCVSTGSPCSHWTVDSTDALTAPNMLVARLERVSSKGNSTPVNYGDYYMSFAFEVTNP